MEHHRKIPTDDNWWNVRGPEQGWLHRHVDQMFPSTTVYRNGPVSELEYDLMDEIGEVMHHGAKYTRIKSGSRCDQGERRENS